MEVFWTTLCRETNVPEEVSCLWWQKINKGYSDPARSYHNEEVMFLTHKLPYLKDMPACGKDLAVALASVFQYLEYRPKTDLSDENCSLFRDFAAEAGLAVNQVSG